MSFNVRYDNPQDGENDWPHRRGRVAEMISASGADVVALQEPLLHQLVDLEQRLSGYRWWGAGREDGDREGEFAPLFYRGGRFTLLDGGTFWLSETPDEPGSRGWDAKQPRIATWAKLEERQGGASVCIFNTHLDNRGPRAREEGAKLLSRRIPEIVGPMPVILCGDFNCRPGSPPYRILTGTAESADGDAGAVVHEPRSVLRDARSIAAAPPSGPDSTWNGFAEILPGERIDFVMVGPSVGVRWHRIVDESRGGRYPSDHLPVLVELELAGR